ncbi:MAG UNVERIFIED_CONTAM: DUF1015 domain-containing protein [Planctomycetaceae bacterium]
MKLLLQSSHRKDCSRDNWNVVLLHCPEPSQNLPETLQKADAMPRIKPFQALRPTEDLAAKVASVPYDVVNRDEAAALADGNPLSFLHVVRPDIDFAPEQNPYCAEGLRTRRPKPETADDRRSACSGTAELPLCLPPGHERPCPNRDRLLCAHRRL